MRKLTDTINRRVFGALLGAKLGVLATGASAYTRSLNQRSQAHTVTIKRFRFVPEHLEIKVGDIVEWVNEDNAPHTATEDNVVWDTGNLEKSEWAQIEFKEAATYNYICAYHPHMKGTLTVLA
ncbi:cupredoxin domain-containing protein [Sulfitobacter pacificus]|uniref:EfeO-type cupredoxin-like domain-containing protein n=1 Tax=Sulfitobacter pacificus TaxID=1499314 RepID=A0ABQ5VF39_9RHOB|nr:cupredoxin family copper-binding protein [Sulfitobacter pacificus]GLQ25637.1 hypothetical protein GCM10007927_04400 [Sulfitobacter pacificus]